MSEHHEKTGYEKRDVDLKKLLLATMIPSVLIILCLIGLDQYMTLANEHKYYKQVLNVEDQVLADLIQKENHALNNYETTGGKVRIPVTRAMQLIVQESK